MLYLTLLPLLAFPLFWYRLCRAKDGELRMGKGKRLK